MCLKQNFSLKMNVLKCTDSIFFKTLGGYSSLNNYFYYLCHVRTTIFMIINGDEYYKAAFITTHCYTRVTLWHHTMNVQQDQWDICLSGTTSLYIWEFSSEITKETQHDRVPAEYQPKYQPMRSVIREPWYKACKTLKKLIAFAFATEG